MPSISTVLPAYNEEGNIVRTVTAVIKVMKEITPDYEIIVVDDGSRDRTASVILELAQQHPTVRLVRHPVNLGYGSALASGFAAATKDIIFFTDGDNQFDVSEVTKFVPYISNSDLVIGYRSPRKDPLHRRLYGRGWNALGNFIFGYTARDVDCAFKLFNRQILDYIHIGSRGATFSLEFLVRSRLQGFRITELSVKHLPRLAGKPTGARLDVILRAFKELIRFRQQLVSERKEALSKGNNRKTREIPLK